MSKMFFKKADNEAGTLVVTFEKIKDYEFLNISLSIKQSKVQIENISYHTRIKNLDQPTVVMRGLVYAVKDKLRGSANDKTHFMNAFSGDNNLKYISGELEKLGKKEEGKLTVTYKVKFTELVNLEIQGKPTAEVPSAEDKKEVKENAPDKIELDKKIELNHDGYKPANKEERIKLDRRKKKFQKYVPSYKPSKPEIELAQ